MVDAAALTDAFHHDAGPGLERGIIGFGFCEGGLDGQGLPGPAGGGAQRCGRNAHAGYGHAGQGQRAADGRAQTEFQAQVEQQPLADPAGGTTALLGAGGGVPERDEVGPLHDRRVQQMVALDRRGGSGHDLAGEVVEKGVATVQGGGDRGAQCKGMRPGLDEPGPVGGVLNGVAEDQGAFVGGIQTTQSEQVGQGHGEQGGHGRADVADGIACAAGRAGLALGVLLRGHARVEQHGDNAVVLLRGAERASGVQCGLGGVEPHE